ncbi:titin [Caerostris extrusa]|uniref:Titin n=1 Tax=Caerostris extrusa TaxID=172846 RepID=A0AAV4Y2K3_CAEEX|nr:titin [Caerostris extrusa]
MVSVGEKVITVCGVKVGSKPMTFKWSKDGKDIKNIPQASVEVADDYSMLSITSATKENMGNYTCTVENNFGKDETSFPLVIKAPPSWVNIPHDVKISEDKPVLMDCMADGHPRPTVSWMKDGNLGTISFCALCFTLTVLTSISTGINVTKDTPIIQPFTFPETASQGQRVTAACGILQGSKPLTFQWTKDGKEITDVPNTSVDVQAEYSVLTISPASKNNVGNYTCIVRNSFGQHSHDASFALKEAPSWIKEPEDVVGIEGQRIEIKCSADGLPKPEISWKRTLETQTIELGDFADQQKDGTLIISSLKIQNAGTYVCEAKNGIGSFLQKGHCSLCSRKDGKDIKDIPNVIVDIQRDYSALTIGPAQTENVGNYTCSAENKFGKRFTHGTLMLRGFREDNIQPVKEDSNTQIFNNGTLFIASIREQNSGIYVCNASNDLDSTISKSVTVNVNGRCCIMLYYSTFLDGYFVVVAKRRKEIESVPNSSVHTLAGFSVLTVGPASRENVGNYTCLVNNSYGKDSYTASFVLNGGTLLNSERIDSPSNMQVFNNGSLIIYNVKDDTRGSYQCTASNDVGEKLEKKVEIFVSGPPVWKIRPSNVETVVGKNATFECSAAGRPPPTVSWSRESDNEPPMRENLSDGGKYATSNGFLTVINTQKEDQGKYTCIVANDVGTALQESVILSVLTPPKWLEKPTDRTSYLESKFEIQYLQQNFKKLNSNNQMNVSNEGFLTIASVSEGDEGLYKCNGDNGVEESLSAEFLLTVYVPARFEEKFKVETVRQGDSAVLRCDVTGDQPISIVWFKDKRELEITELSRNVDRRDGALYSCTATNDYGSDERNIKVLVVEVPAQPLDVKVLDVWAKSASIRWSAPYTGNSAITKYKVQFWRDKHGPQTLNEAEISATQTTAVIQDLKPGISYALAVVAENEIGHGEPSETIRFLTSEEEPSGPPTDLYVEARGPTSILVKWKPPPKECWNGELKGYYVGYRPEGANHAYTFKSIEANANESNEYFDHRLDQVRSLQHPGEGLQQGWKRTSLARTGHSHLGWW